MIGFVTWTPFIIDKKGGQVTKSITVVKNMLQYCVSFKELKYFDKVTWPQLISNFWSHLPVCSVASDWPCTFLYLCFCLAIFYTNYTNINTIHHQL